MSILIVYDVYWVHWEKCTQQKNVYNKKNVYSNKKNVYNRALESAD